MNKPILRAQPTERRIARAGDVLVSNRVLGLSTLLRRSASLLYRRELGLSQNEWSTLAIVGDHAPLSLGQLVDFISLDKGQISRTVSALVKRRILSRTPDPKDSREVRIDLTPRGREIFEALIALALTRNRELVAGLSKAELTTVFSALDRMLVNARTMLAQSQARTRRSS